MGFAVLGCGTLDLRSTLTLWVRDLSPNNDNSTSKIKLYSRTTTVNKWGGIISLASKNWAWWNCAWRKQTKQLWPKRALPVVWNDS